MSGRIKPFRTEDEPSPIYHHLIMQPIYFIIFAFGAEFIFRRNPQIGIWIVIITFFTIPIYYIYRGLYTIEYGIDNIELFSLIKAYIVAIPVFLDQSLKLSLTTEKLTLCDVEGNKKLLRLREQHKKKLYRCPLHKYILSKTCIMNFYNNKEKRKCFVKFMYIFLFLNISEAVLFEAFLAEEKSYFDYGRYFNAISGLLLAISIPRPFYPHFTFWEINSYKCVYGDFVMYCSWGWIILYSIWNVEFTGRFFEIGRHAAFYNGTYLLLIPICRSLFRNDWSEFWPVKEIWVQSRAYVLFIYATIVIPFKNALINSTMKMDFISQDDYYYNGFLLIFSLFNMIFGIIYVCYYYMYFRPKLVRNTIRQLQDIEWNVDKKQISDESDSDSSETP